MNITPNPIAVAAARTARLVREAQTPVYSTSTPVPSTSSIDAIEDRACDEDWCRVCSRSTDHRGEHSDEQLLAWATGKGQRLSFN